MKSLNIHQESEYFTEFVCTARDIDICICRYFYPTVFDDFAGIVFINRIPIGRRIGVRKKLVEGVSHKP